MIIRIWVLLCLLITSPAALAQVPSEAGTSYRMRSEILQEDREYTISLPSSYKWQASRRYPTLYVLDGKAHFLHTAGTVRHLSASGEIPEMIVVAVASTVRIRDFTQSDWSEAWVGGGGAGKFKQFLAAELIPHVEKQFRTDGYRVLSGHSAGAQFVLHSLATAPGAFRGHIALAPSLDWHTRLPARELEASLTNWRKPRSFLYFAYADDAGQALADDQQLVEVLKRGAPANLLWQVRAYPDETHLSLPLVGQIDGLRALYSGYRFHNDRASEGIAGADKHFQILSERLGWPVPVPESVINALGYAALGEDRHADAIKLFERNAAAHPDSANAFDSLAETYSMARRHKDASKAAATAARISSDPDHPNHAHFAKQAKDLAAAAIDRR